MDYSTGTTLTSCTRSLRADIRDSRVCESEDGCECNGWNGMEWHDMAGVSGWMDGYVMRCDAMIPGLPSADLMKSTLILYSE